MKLIDILNKIANGELKEGTVVVWDDVEYPYKNKCLYGADGEKLFYWINTGDLNDEVELIEPNHSPDVGKMAGPTDNTKIEELNADYYEGQPKAYTIEAIIKKLNEVIRELNRRNK